MLPLTIWVSGASFAVAIVGVFVYRVLALLLPMPVSLAALPTPRKLAEGQDKPTGRRTSPRCALQEQQAILRSLDADGCLGRLEFGPMSGLLGFA